jgi:hypothetical protein
MIGETILDDQKSRGRVPKVLLEQTGLAESHHQERSKNDMDAT